jgi:inosose dehydratase
VKAGINVWTWGFDNREVFEQALREVGDLQYEAVENIGSIAEVYEDDPQSFRDVVQSHGLEFACAYHHFSGDCESDVARAERFLGFLAQVGGSIMNLQAAARPAGGPSDADLATTARYAVQIGELARTKEITLCLHPHYGTIVERAEELAYMMDQVSPDLMSLTLDTAHTVLGGMDPVATFEQYAWRVRYVHVKDIVPIGDRDAPWWSGFRELGRGIVNFPAIADILGGAGFDGVLCVELDRPRVCGYKSAAISREYLREELGI